MAYTYQTGTANHVIHFFALLETFLTSVGWTVVGGTGTTTVIFSSPGEGGGRTKLFCRFRQDGGFPEIVYYRVQDDLAGTHATTDGAVAQCGYLTAPGAGVIPFQYFMAADKDKAIVNFKAGAGYSGAYVGIVEPFALAVDEEEQMVSIGLHKNISPNDMGYVLKDDAGNWDERIRGGQVDVSYVRDPLDNSVTIYGLRVDEGAFNKIVGQPMDVSGRMQTVLGVNSEDIITTGYVGATSTWIVMGSGICRWCMRTGGNVPVGNLEGAHFSHTNGLATNMADLIAKLDAFMAAIGWTKIANPAPLYPVDFFYNSPGESGVDDIYIRVYYDNVPVESLVFFVTDDTLSTHTTSQNALYAEPANFPAYYYFTADRDCLMITFERLGLFPWVWAGMYQMFFPDPDSYATPYKSGVLNKILRDHSGNWNETLAVRADGSLNSSPNLYDGVTNVVWQHPVVRNTDSCPIGAMKYVHIISGPGLSVMDTVAIAGRSFRVLDLGVNTVAMREV